MDLFMINRFLGDDKTGEISSVEEKSRLAQLLSKVEERKKRKDDSQEVKFVESSMDTAAVPQDASEEPKTDKSSVDNVAVSQDADEEIKQDVDRTDDVKKTQKKRALSDSDDDELVHDVTNSDNVSSKRRKRRKKSKSPNNEETEKIEGFMVLGQDNFQKKSKVKRVLPYWLANPTVISVNLQELVTKVEDVRGLDKSLVDKLKNNNITHFFPVQSEVIPWLLAAHRMPPPYRPWDVCVSSPTGSGKTLAFVLPIIQALKDRFIPRIRALVVLPVQDLAVQVYKVFVNYCLNTPLKVTLITGQNSFQREQQQLIRTHPVIGPYSLVDIVVATPGRLVDHIKLTPNFTLKYLKFLVIDEADRVMENVQNNWLYHVEKFSPGNSAILTVASLWKQYPPPPQKLLFSATLSQDPEKLQQLSLFQPKLFTSVIGKEIHDPADNAQQTNEELRGDFVGKYTTPAELEEKACMVSMSTKPLALYHLIIKNKWQHVLCFTNSQLAAHRLALLLGHLGNGEFKVAEISSALKRSVRDHILQKFIGGEFNIIVCTDSLARGMDIPGVEYVVSYDPPKYVKTYIHRIGRTGRAGRHGTAVTLILNNQVGHFRHILQVAGKSSVGEISVSESKLKQYEGKYRDALEAMRQDIQKKVNEVRRKERKIIRASLWKHKAKPLLKKDIQNPENNKK